MGKQVLKKWNDCLVAIGREPASETVDEFDRVLSDAPDERPLQKFLASFPALLGQIDTTRRKLLVSRSAPARF